MCARSLAECSTLLLQVHPLVESVSPSIGAIQGACNLAIPLQECC